MKKWTKKVTVIILTMSMTLLVGIPALANSNTDNCAEQLVAKTAYLNDIDAYGSNWKNDTLTGNAYIKEDTVLIQTHNQQNLVLEATVNNEPVIITATPTGKNENGNVVYFEGSINNEDYSVVTMSYEEDIQDSIVYFDGYMKDNNKNSSNLLKLYLKENNSSSNNYIVFEVFDYDLPYNKELLDSIPTNSLLGAWVVEEFEPISFETVESEVMQLGSNTYELYNATFAYAGAEQTHTIVVGFYSDPKNMIVGGEANQVYELFVASKSINCPTAPNYNSSTDSYLHVDDVKLTLSSPTNTAWRYAIIDGEANSGVEVEASITIFTAPLLSVSIPLNGGSAGFWASVDVNENVNIYRNTSSNYTRVVEFEMADNFALALKNQFFGVICNLGDEGNVASESKSISAKWEYTILNMHTAATTSDAITINKTISIR